MDRVFVSAESFQGEQALVSGVERHHLADVLRVQVGDRFLATDGLGHEFLLEAESVSRKELGARIVERRELPPDPGAGITLAIAPPRGARMDTAVEKSVECGVGRILPMRAERSVLKGRDDSARAERWSRLVRSAVAQSGRSHCPEITPVLLVAEALARTAAEGTVLIAHPGPDAVSVPVAMAAAGDRPVAIFVGPEGGFSDAELEEGRRIGASLVTLGPTRLRTETAAIVAVTLALAARSGSPPRA